MTHVHEGGIIDVGEGACPVCELRIWVPGRPPTPNARPGNVFAQRRELTEWRAKAKALALDVANRRRWRTPRLALLSIVFVVPTHQRRDWDNLIAGTKPLTDGLVDARVLADDSLDAIGAVAYSWRYQAGVAGTEYTVRALEHPQEELALDG